MSRPSCPSSPHPHSRQGPAPPPPISVFFLVFESDAHPALVPSSIPRHTRAVYSLRHHHVVCHRLILRRRRHSRPMVRPSLRTALRLYVTTPSFQSGQNRGAHTQSKTRNPCHEEGLLGRLIRVRRHWSIRSGASRGKREAHAGEYCGALRCEPARFGNLLFSAGAAIGTRRPTGVSDLRSALWGPGFEDSPDIRHRQCTPSPLSGAARRTTTTPNGGHGADIHPRGFGTCHRRQPPCQPPSSLCLLLLLLLIVGLAQHRQQE